MQRTISGLILILSPLGVFAGDCTGPGAAFILNPNVLSGQTVCGSSGSDTWQEWHQTSGTLTEYAKGPGHPVDPTHDVGSWSLGSGNTITYNYTGGSSYTFELWLDLGNSSLLFCESGAGTNAVATVNTTFTGQGACPP